MAEHHSFEDILIENEYYNNLMVREFSMALDHTTQSYKYYWLEAIVQCMVMGMESISMESIVDEMIANAWYTVREFHIHLTGIKSKGTHDDLLEILVNKLANLSNLPSNASHDEIVLKARQHHASFEKEIIDVVKYVPYRALSSFFHLKKGERFQDNFAWFENQVAKEQLWNELPYRFGGGMSWNKTVYFNPAWIAMFQDNAVQFLSWINNKKAMWLQKNNPEVPGIVYKLQPLNEKERQLKCVRNLWKGILSQEGSQLENVFSEDFIQVDCFAIDHFIPWSFVMNDELWNLMPMDSSLNSSKNNKLPEWEPFFPKYARNQYLLYSQVKKNDAIHKLFENCYKDNLHSLWAIQDLYGKDHENQESFQNILDENMKPVYDSARRQGYAIWKL